MDNVHQKIKKKLQTNDVLWNLNILQTMKIITWLIIKIIKRKERRKIDKNKESKHFLCTCMHIKYGI